MVAALAQRVPKPIAMLVKLLWTLALIAGTLALGGVIGKRLTEPQWESVISYSGSVFFILVLLRNPLVGLLLWIIFAPFFGFALLHISLGRGIPDLSLSRLVIVTLVGLLAAQLATGRRRLIRITRVDVLVLLSLIGLGISLVPAIAKGPSLAWFFESFTMPVLTYFVARHMITDERGMVSAQRALVAVGILISLVVIQEQLMGVSWFPTEGSTAYGKNLRRATGLLGNPAFTAVCIAMCLPFAWRAMLEHPQRGPRRLLFIAIALMYAGLVLTYNRTGWAAGAVGIVIMFLFYPRFRQPFLKVAPFMALLLLFFWSDVSSSYAVTERLVATNPINARLQSYKAALLVFADYPIAGIGFGNIWYLAGTYASRSSVPLDDIVTPHNTYLWVMVTAGLVGIIPYVGAFLAMAWDSVRMYAKARYTPALRRDLLVAFWVALIAYTGQAFAVDMLYGVYSNILIFFIAGCVFGYQVTAEKEAGVAATHMALREGAHG